MGPGARAPGARHGRRRRRRRRWDGAGKVVVDGITAAQNGRAQCRYVNHFGLVENFTDSSSPDPKNLPLTSLSCFISTSASSYHQRWLLLIREVWHNFLERPKNRFRDDWTDHSYVERKKLADTWPKKFWNENRLGRIGLLGPKEVFKVTTLGSRSTSLTFRAPEMRKRSLVSQKKL